MPAGCFRLPLPQELHAGRHIEANRKIVQETSFALQLLVPLLAETHFAVTVSLLTQGKTQDKM